MSRSGEMLTHKDLEIAKHIEHLRRMLLNFIKYLKNK